MSWAFRSSVKRDNFIEGKHGTVNILKRNVSDQCQLSLKKKGKKVVFEITCFVDLCAFG